jgi:hypothetical protein
VQTGTGTIPWPALQVDELTREIFIQCNRRAFATERPNDDDVAFG